MIHNFFFFFSLWCIIHLQMKRCSYARHSRPSSSESQSHTLQIQSFSGSWWNHRMDDWAAPWRIFLQSFVWQPWKQDEQQVVQQCFMFFHAFIRKKKPNTLSVTHYSTVQIPLRNPRSRHWICFCESQTLKKPRGRCDVAGVTAGVQESGNKTLIPLDMSEFILF